MKDLSTARASSSNTRTSRNSRRRQGGDGSGADHGSSTSSYAGSRKSRGSKNARAGSHSSKKTLSFNDDDLDRATKNLHNSKSKPKSSSLSKQTPSSTSRSRTHRAIKEGAYPIDDSYSGGSNLGDQVPFVIFTPPRPKLGSSENKSYKIFVAPEDPSTLASYCLLPIGEVSTLCLNKNCFVNHRGSGDRMPIMPGEVFIMADKSRAFKEPSSNSFLWDANLYTAWSRESAPVSDWMERFQFVKNQSDLDPNTKIDPNTIGSEALFTQKV